MEFPNQSNAACVGTGPLSCDAFTGVRIPMSRIQIQLFSKQRNTTNTARSIPHACSLTLNSRIRTDRSKTDDSPKWHIQYLDFFKHLMPRLLPVATRPRYMSPPPTEMASFSHRSSRPESLPLLAGTLQNVTSKTHIGHICGLPASSLWSLTASKFPSTPTAPSYLSPFPLAWVSCVCESARPLAGWTSRCKYANDSNKKRK